MLERFDPVARECRNVLPQALHQYGDQVDAIINVSYESNPRNDVFGTGLAVQFVQKQPDERGDQKDDVASRLEKLEDLRARKLISVEEYDRLRKDVLRDL